jgi:hypothetical protein
MLSFLSFLRTRRVWFHTWRIEDDLHRECTVCGQREQRDADGDLMCDAPGAWWVARSGRPIAHLRQTRQTRQTQQTAPRPAAEPSIGTGGSYDAASDDELMA